VDTLVYSIRISNLDGLDSLSRNNPMIDFYGIETLETENHTLVMVGKFYEYALAKQALFDIQTKTKLSQLRIVRRIDLEEKNLSPRKDNPD
jgi:hypothetical protein